MMKALLVTGFMSLAVVAGCGGDDDKPAGEPGTPNKQAATSTTQTTISAVQTAIKPSSGGTSSGQASANQLAGAAQAAQNAVQPASPSGTTAQSVGVGGLALATFLHPAADPPGTGGCTCTETSCSFKACTIGQTTIDGDYSWGGGKVKTSGLKYTIKSAAGGFGAEIVIDLTCDLTVTATSLAGTFRSKGTTSTNVAGSSYSSNWDTSLEFKDVAFPSGGGAPTGGSIHVDGTVTTGVAGAVQTYTAAYDVTFPSG